MWNGCADVQLSAAAVPGIITRTVRTVRELTAALADSSIDHILVAEGSYKLGARLNITRAVVIEAAVPGKVVLDGQRKCGVLHIEVTTANAAVRLIGLTFTKGSTTYGGGVYVFAATTVHFHNCEIVDNQSNSPFGNSGGGMYISDGTVTITNTSIHANVADYNGGGLYISGAGTDVTITGTSIYSNDADGGTGMLVIDSAKVKIADSKIYSNTAWTGAGVYIYEATVDFQNCEVHDNKAEFGGGGIYKYSGSITIDDRSTVHDNTLDDCSGWTDPACGRRPATTPD